MVDQVVLMRAANARLPDAQPKKFANAFLNLALLGLGNTFLSRLREQSGGLWVGGELTLFKDRVRFTANAANAALQSGDLSQEIPMSEIGEISWRPGIVTGIIDVAHGPARDHHFQFRCFGSKHVAQTLTTLSQRSVPER